MKNTNTAKMNIAIDKDFTTLAQAAQVKADIKEFKATYTPGEVLSAFVSQLTDDDVSPRALVALQCGTVISFTADAFPGGSVYDDATHFNVEVIVDNCFQMVKAQFYTDMLLTVEPYTVTPWESHHAMFRVELFERAERRGW